MAWPRVRPNPAGIVHMTALPRTALAAALLLPVAACGGGTNQVNEVTTFEARAAYAIGQDVGNSLRSSGVELDFDALVQGLRDALDEVEQPLLDETGAMQAIQEFQMQAQQAMMAQQEAAGAENRAEGETFLAENATREGWMTTESGLQYRVVEQGDGPTPGPNDQVRVHYRGTFVDGETFDSSYDRGEPAVFGVGGVIPGWTEALQLMPVGSTYELAIPSDLAYGPNGPPAIGPDRTLLFEVELLEIVN